jgi:uncharacterized protein YkwD
MSRGLVKAVKVLGLTLALSVVLGAVAPTAHAAWTPRREMLSWMNSARSNHGAAGLSRVWVIRQLADDHSRDMAAEGRIFHTTALSSKLRAVSWSVAGENVGAGVELRALFDAFMRSDAHRANILQPRFRRVGIGIVRSDGFIWITLIFVG